KELAALRERRGFRDRAWAVEWESSALEFLLERGFSPEMGARPLKRAIDQYVVAPLAAMIVEKRFPAGDQFLFVRSDGEGIQVQFVDPDADAISDPVAPVTGSITHSALASAILTPRALQTNSRCWRPNASRWSAGLARPSGAISKTYLPARCHRPIFGIA